MYRRCTCDDLVGWCNRAEPVPDTNHIIFVDSYFGSLETLVKAKISGNNIVCSSRTDRPSYIFSNFLHPKLNGMGSWSQASCKIAALNRDTLVWIYFTAASYLSQTNSNNSKICNYLSSLPEHES